MTIAKAPVKNEDALNQVVGNTDGEKLLYVEYVWKVKLM